MRRTISRTAALAVLALLGGLLGACEAIVGDSLPASIQCSGNLASSCPTGQSCIDGLCIPSSFMVNPDASRDARVDTHVVVVDTGVDAGHDAGHDATKPVVDTGVDVSTTPVLGQTCTASAANPCSSGLFCLDTADLVGLGVGAGTICSAICCSNSDCGGANVCYGTTGGNYCITAAVAESKCGAGGCGTACCSSASADCTGGALCGLVSSGTSGSSSPVCATFAKDTACEGVPDCSGVPGDPCNVDTDCQSGVCGGCELGECNCVEAVDCCSASDCAGNASGNNYCTWNSASDDESATQIFRSCWQGGPDENGASCTKYTDCQGGMCEKLGGTKDVCTQPCCHDTDCTSPAGWVCRPFAAPDFHGAPLLLCQPPTSVEN